MSLKITGLDELKKQLDDAAKALQALDGDIATLKFNPKPQWEFPRLCRGGSKSLTYPAVDTAAPSTKLRIAIDMDKPL
jgi:hypothetical protein